MIKLSAAGGLLIVLSGFGLSNASAAPAFPPNVNVENHSLVLNGVGTRKATLFKIKVYDAGLYLEKKSKDPQQILASNEIKRVDLVFLRGVSRGQIVDAWKESIDKNCGSDCPAIKPQESKLLDMMSDMREGDTMAFVFLPDRLSIWVKGKLAGTIDGANFGRIVLSSWLGPSPPNPEIKEGMLGGQ